MQEADRLNTNASNANAVIATAAAGGIEYATRCAICAVAGGLALDVYLNETTPTLHKGDTIGVVSIVELTDDTDSGYEVVQQTITYTDESGAVVFSGETQTDASNKTPAPPQNEIPDDD